MTDTLIPDASIQTRPPGPVEWRSAVVADVNRRERIVEVIAVPYNEETLVEYPPGSGKTIMESVLPGAFEGIDTRSHRITVNREHDYGKTIGIARNLYPSAKRALLLSCGFRRGRPVTMRWGWPRMARLVRRLG